MPWTTGLSKEADKWADWKLKEVKNGRLAMLAFLGFVAQKYATGESIACSAICDLEPERQTYPRAVASDGLPSSLIHKS